MTELHYDLFVIGAGSAGVRLARMAALRGVKTGIAEYQALGGTCVNVGCVPKKLLKYAADFRDDFHMASGYGYDIENRKISFNFETLMNRKDQEIKRLNSIYQGLLERSGCDIFYHKAFFIDSKRLQVGEDVITADRIVIAVGGRPFVPDVLGKELIETSDDFFAWKEFPKRVLVVGGGYIAVELASILRHMGSEVALCYRGSNLLKSFDRATVSFMQCELEKKGMDIKLETDVVSLEKCAGGIDVHLRHGEVRTVDRVLYATGRIPALDGLQCEKAGIKKNENGTLVVDEHFQTTCPNVYALGDVVGNMPLTPVAIREAMALLEHLYGTSERAMSYDFIPTAVFCSPEMATVGYSEEDAKKHNVLVKVYQSSFRPMKHVLGNNEERMLIRMVVAGEEEKVVGLHICGQGASEMVQGFSVAVRAGLCKKDFDATVGIHPTSAEEVVTLRD